MLCRASSLSKHGVFVSKKKSDFITKMTVFRIMHMTDFQISSHLLNVNRSQSTLCIHCLRSISMLTFVNSTRTGFFSSYSVREQETYATDSGASSPLTKKSFDVRSGQVGCHSTGLRKQKGHNVRLYLCEPEISNTLQKACCTQVPIFSILATSEKM